MSRRQRTRIQPYIDATLAQRLDVYSVAEGLTESAVVQDALYRYLDRTNDAVLVLRSLDRLGRAEERTKRHVDILTEAFGAWFEICFAHTPNIDEERKPLARHSAASRHAPFVEFVSRRLSGGHRFIDDPSQEPVADEAELTRLAAGDGPPSDDKDNRGT